MGFVVHKVALEQVSLSTAYSTLIISHPGLVK
jgi:hypothetical protein